MKKLCIAICADDYAQHEGIDQAICILLAQQRLSAVSCMSSAPRWPASAARLPEFQNVADFGLHFNLTESFATKAASSPLASLIIRAYLRQLSATTIATQLQQQCDAFEKHLRQAPAFIDGHQHIHQLPLIRDVMQKVLIQRYGDNLPWVRNTVPDSVWNGKKALILKVLGGAKLRARLKRAKFVSNQGFSGVYDFNTVNYGALFEQWLQRIRNHGVSGHLIMCHPASSFPESDVIGSARKAEYAFFNSDAFPRLLEQYQISIQRLSDIFLNAQFPPHQIKPVFLKPGNLLPLVLFLLLFHLLLWSILTGISHTAPAQDNMEQLVWGSSLEWGYYKHPPLPSWVMHAMMSLFGHPIWLTFFTAQLSVVSALFFIWKLGCEFSFTPAARLQQSSYALVVMLLTSLIVYFTIRGLMNNHNTMQLWSVAGAIWMFYRATRHQRLADWAWLGMFCGFAMLTKYSTLIQLFCFFVYLLCTGKLRQKSTWHGIAIASLIFLLLMAPHIFWLAQQSSGNSAGHVTHSDNPLSYASHSINKPISRIEQLNTVWEFVVTNMGRITLFLLASGFLVWWNRRKSNVPSTQPTIASQLDPSDRLFLLINGISPLVFTLFFAVLFNVPLISHWAATFFLLSGFFSWWFLSDSAACCVGQFTL